MVLLGGQVGRVATVAEQDSVAQIEKIRREIVGGALPKELATGAEGLFVPTCLLATIKPPIPLPPSRPFR